MAPTLVTHYEVYSASADQTTLTTPSFTPANGEVLVVKLATWDTGNGMAAPTGGSQTYTAAIIGAPGGFAGWTAAYVATVSGSPTNMTVSAAVATASNTRHSMIVERWSGATVDATPAVNGTVHGTGSFSTGLTTTTDNSVISWIMVEENSVDPATRAYLLSATEDGLYDGHVGSNSVHYSAYAAVTTAGTYNFGLSAPTGLNWTTAAVEIKAAAVVITPNGLAVPVALGTPTVGLVGASPNGLAVPVALGQPTSGQPTSAPSGLAVPVALGPPTAGRPTSAPAGLAVPVALGQPTVSAATTTPNGLAVPVALGTPTVGLVGASPNGIPVPVGLGGQRDLSVHAGSPLTRWVAERPATRWVADPPTT